MSSESRRTNLTRGLRKSAADVSIASSRCASVGCSGRRVATHVSSLTCGERPCALIGLLIASPTLAKDKNRPRTIEVANPADLLALGPQWEHGEPGLPRAAPLIPLLARQEICRDLWVTFDLRRFSRRVWTCRYAWE